MRRTFYDGLKLKETNQDSMVVFADFDAMKEILRIILQVDGDILLNGPKQYDSAFILKLYKAALTLGVGYIRSLCIKQMLDRPSIEMALVAIDLNLHNVTIDILKKLDSNSIFQFLCRPNTHPIFSKEDLLFVFKKVRGIDLSICIPSGSPESKNVLNLEEVATEIEKPRIDLTKKWPACDMAILTKNSAERVLYANKGTLASVSDHFRKLFFSENMKENADFEVNGMEPGVSVIHLDVEYATMKTILSIVHHCDMNSYNLWEQFTGHNLDVALKLNLINVQTRLLTQMDWKVLVDWIHSDEKSLVYLNDGKEVILSSKQTDPVMSLNNLRDAYNKLLKVPFYYPGQNKHGTK